MKIIQALYGLKTQELPGKNTGYILRRPRFFSSKAEPDVSNLSRIKPNGYEYYSMVHVYINNIMHFDHAPGVLMIKLEESYCLKDEAQVPDRNLSTNIDKFQLK